MRKRTSSREMDLINCDLKLMNICLLNLQNYYKKVPEKVESLERIKYEINQYNPYFNGA